MPRKKSPLNGDILQPLNTNQPIRTAMRWCLVRCFMTWPRCRSARPLRSGDSMRSKISSQDARVFWIGPSVNVWWVQHCVICAPPNIQFQTDVISRFSVCPVEARSPWLVTIILSVATIRFFVLVASVHVIAAITTRLRRLCIIAETTAAVLIWEEAALVFFISEWRLRPHRRVNGFHEQIITSPTKT